MLDPMTKSAESITKRMDKVELSVKKNMNDEAAHGHVRTIGRTAGHHREHPGDRHPNPQLERSNRPDEDAFRRDWHCPTIAEQRSESRTYR
eukprot:1594869-Pyramimonas_sp.AAC.1